MKKLIGLLSLIFSMSTVYGQFVVKGKVTDDSDGSPLIGVNVVVDGTTIGTTTDFDGNYEIDAGSAEGILLFSYIGYEDQRIAVEGRNTIDIVLGDDAQQLEEIIVVGYGTEKRSKISGSVSTLSAEDITETPINRVEQALQGKTAGVQVSQVSGSPGSAMTVRIRGVGTLNNADPIYIVDGLQVDGLDFLNPNDIESINILKDAASTAIYGSRGANGVVLITTKSGSKKKTDGTIAYSGYIGTQSAWKNINLLNATEYATINNEMRIAAGLTPYAEFAQPNSLGEGTDWQSAIFETAPMSSHQLSFNKASQDGAFGLSFGAFDQDGIVGGDKAKFQRYTLRVVGSQRIKNWVEVGANINMTRLKRDAITENNQYTSPVIRALNIDPYTNVYKGDGTYAYSKYFDSDIGNPVNSIDQTFNTWQTDIRIVGNAYTELKLMEGLKFKSIFSGDMTRAIAHGFNRMYDLSVDPDFDDAPPQDINDDFNSVGETHNRWTKWQIENILTYNTVISEDHSVEGLLGNTMLYDRFDVTGASRENLPSNEVEDAHLGNTIALIEEQTTYGYASHSSLLSYFVRGKYDYKEKYIASVTMRMDGSSRFGDDNKFGYFPSFSAAWVPTKEDFWNIDAVSFAKLRASYGTNGNDRIGNYPYLALVGQGQNYTFDGSNDISNGQIPVNPGNTEVRWETTRQTDIGLDFELLEGKLYVVMDYFVKNTEDILFQAANPEIAGVVSEPIQNIASVSNRGFELELTHKNNFGAVNYTLAGNVSFLNNEVTGLGSDAEFRAIGVVQSMGTVSRLEVGQSFGAFYGYVTDGVYQNAEEISNRGVIQNGAQPGDFRYKDLNNDGFVDAEDQTFIGNPLPNLSYGFSLGLDFKGFDASVLLSGVSGNDIFKAYTRYDLPNTNMEQSVMGRWTGEGSTNEHARLSLYNDTNGNYSKPSDFFIEDGAYLRVRNVQIGYNLPKTVLSKISLTKCRFYASATNLFTFTDYSGLDPEIGNIIDGYTLGIDYGFYPAARTFTFGLDIGL